MPGKTPVVAVNCSAQGCRLDGLPIASAGLDTPYAVRVYAGVVTGTTIESAGRGTYSAYGVVGRLGLPTGTWQQTLGAGWEMSGAPNDAALTFLVAGEKKPRKVISADGSVQYRHAGAAALPATADDDDDDDDGLAAVSVLSGHLTNTTAWDPPHLAGNGGVVTTRMGLVGVRPGDAVAVGLSSVRAEDDESTAQLTATAGVDIAKVVLQNVGGEAVDIQQGRLRLVVQRCCDGLLVFA